MSALEAWSIFGAVGSGTEFWVASSSEDAFAGGAGLMELVVQPRERLDGRINHHDGQNKGEKVRRFRLLVFGRNCMLCWT